MELNRLARIARARWWLFALAAGLGLVVAIVFTSYLNGNIASSYEATAPLAVIRDPGSQTEDLEEKTFVVLDEARLTNQALVLESDYRIELAVDSIGIVNFVARGSDPVDAADKAEQMRSQLIARLDALRRRRR